MKINPVYQKELKTSVRSVRTAVILLGYNAILALFGLFAFYVTFEYDSRYGGTVDYSSILQIYAIITAAEFGLVLFTVPALTAAAISGEREKQTLEILLTTKLTPFQIILGKLASSISMMILLAVSSLPVLAIVFTIGGITLRDFLVFMLLIVVTAVFVGSIGIFFSTLFKKTTSATVTTYGVLLFLGIGTLAILWAIRLVIELKMNESAAGSIVYQTPDAGNWILILLINPGVTFFSMIEDQIGTGSRLTSFFGNFGTVSMGVQNVWFYVSVSIQLGISVILLIGSAKLLDPLRDRYCRKKRRR
ncbi:ABC transporter permease subunit [Anaerocolumna sp. AGMB13025]|uniref:ABC transporter permease n=1 Tax=Anaerocolumna sp. AGMB13025 TaxID=3039116 RepID=UPI00241D19F2|nr:ABC transporter permease subunit [Anaerocolumna sp. AGMB13025]WFR56336.1 ABC transporter permease subunit [Anaerocolumna sp. AGMB13025]